MCIRDRTETEAADAILCASSDQIGEATAVYVDDSLRFVLSLIHI